jgi:hypothetical protein
MKQEHRLKEALNASDIGIAMTGMGYLVDTQGDMHKYGKQCGNGNRTVDELDQFLADNGIECRPIVKLK